MLPIPFIKFIPSAYRERGQTEMTALCDKADTHIELWRDDAINLKCLLDVECCPAIFLNQLGNYVNAGIRQEDSETTKRQKIYTAIQSHKARGSWVYHVKPVIDAITGYSAALVRATDEGDWILVDDGVVLDPSSYWAVMGHDGTIDMGLSIIGDFTEVEVAGNIYIDCHDGVHTAVLTAAQIAKIVFEISLDIIPAYMRIYIGYIDATGAFIFYDTIA